jgi:hypothetical protein
LVGGWREKEEGEGEVKKTVKEEKNRRLKWIRDNWLVGGWREEGEVKEEKVMPKDDQDAAELGQAGSGSGKGSSREESEPLAKEPENSQTAG